MSGSWTRTRNCHWPCHSHSSILVSVSKLLICFWLGLSEFHVAHGWGQLPLPYPNPYTYEVDYTYDTETDSSPQNSHSVDWLSDFQRVERFDLESEPDFDQGFEDFDHGPLQPQYRTDRIIINEEGIPVRVVYPVGYRPPPPRPTAPPTTTVSPFAIQIAELNKQEASVLKRKKKKRPSDPLLDQEGEDEDYDDNRDQYDEEEATEFLDADTSSEEVDDYYDYDDGDGATNEELDDYGNYDLGGGGGGWGQGQGGGGGGGKKKKKQKQKNKNKNKGKNKKKKKCKRKKGQNCNMGPPRPPPWHKYARLPRPQRLQEVELWGYQNEYNRGWGMNKHLHEKQKAAWIAARKREAEYKEWFENLPEERQEEQLAIVRAHMEQRRRVQYQAYGHALREIGGLPLAPSGPDDGYYVPPPGTPTAGRGPTGGGWTTGILGL